MDTKKGTPESAPLLNETTRKDSNLIDSALILSELNRLSNEINAKLENKFPVDGLPIAIKAYAENLSLCYGVPIEMTAIPMLVACAAALQKKVYLKEGKYTNFTQFYIAIVAPSGVGKTEPLKRAFSPLIFTDRVAYENYSKELTEYSLKEKMCKTHKPPLEPPKKPIFKQLLCDDTTPEALTDILSFNNAAVTLLSEELSGWFANFGRYTKQGEAQMYLQYFDNTDKTVNRKTEIKRIKEPYLNIIGTIQPTVLHRTISSEQMQEVGLSSRFLYVSCLDTVRAYKTDLMPNNELADDYTYLINHLVSLPYNFDLQLDIEAKELFRNFGDYLTDIIRTSKNDFFNSSLSKMEIHCLRLALIIHVINLTGEGKTIIDVDAASMQYAIDLCHYFIKNIPLPNKSDLLNAESKTAKVIEMFNNGKKGSEIAEKLGVSKQYVSTVKKKFKLNN